MGVCVHTGQVSELLALMSHGRSRALAVLLLLALGKWHVVYAISASGPLTHTTPEYTVHENMAVAFMEDWRSAYSKAGKIEKFGKTCPRGLKTTVSPFRNSVDTSYTPFASHHSLQECSGNGICDRETGECICSVGFTNAACQQTQCPNHCSGHGVCGPMVDSSSTNDVEFLRTPAWDKFTTRRCVCDPGYFSPDCSKRMCPRGPDPVNHCEELNQPDIQLVDTTDLTTGFFVLRFSSWTGQILDTAPIPTDIEGGGAVQRALESLPNFAIPSVQVTEISSDSPKFKGYAITFSSAKTPGKQNTLVCNPAEYAADLVCEAGVVPKFASTGTCAVSHIGLPETDSSVGYKPTLECSGRGKCNYATGECVCHHGMTGYSCDRFYQPM